MLELLIAALLALTGFSVDTDSLMSGLGSDAMTADEVQAHLEAEAAKIDPNADVDMSCPSDLPLEAGASTDCEMVVAGDAYGLRVTVEDLPDGGDPQLDVKAFLAPAQLEPFIARTIEDDLDMQVSQTTCPEEIVGEIGNTTRCTVTVDGRSRGVRARVTQATDFYLYLDLNVEG